MAAESSTSLASRAFSPTGPRGSDPPEVSKPIQLVDHTKQSTDDQQVPQIQTPAEGDDAQRNKSTGSESPLSPKLTRVSLSLREEISKRKWAKYQEDRTATHKRKRSTGSALSPPPTPGGLQSTSSLPNEGEGEGQDEDAASEPSDTWGESTLERSTRHLRETKERARELLPKLHTEHHSNHPDYIAHHSRPSKEQRQKEQESAIDILYENQRGTFMLGLPMFSSNSLLQFDPPAWVDAHGKASGCDIRDAQVPDPSWRWDWRTWYVDMSRDVDEEGWEYAFWFRKRAVWHGNHPWHLSFVRRRRWLRRRVREQKRIDTAEVAHALNPDYFTIHSKKGRGEGRPMSPSSEGVTSGGRSAPPTSAAWGARDWKELQEEEFAEIASVPALMKALRRASIDREKIVYVNRFLGQGGEELYYLAEEMPEIMRLFLFQNSRRQLLAILMHRFEDAEQHRDEHQKRKEEEGEKEQKYIDNLLRAVEAADEQCKKLEYWSDVKIVVSESETLHAIEHDVGWGHEWQGVESSGPSTSVPASPTEKASEETKAGGEDEPKKEKSKGKIEVASRETEVAPEQMLKRQNTPGVWPSSSEKETSREIQRSDQPMLKPSDENQPPTPSHNIQKTAEMSSESLEPASTDEEHAKPQRDLSRMGKTRVSDSDDPESGQETPQQMLRRRSTPGVWIDGTTEKAETDVKDMEPTSENVKTEHESQHEDMGSKEALTGTDDKHREEHGRDERHSEEEHDDVEDEAEGEEYDEEEGRPFRIYKSAETQLLENLAKLQAEQDRDKGAEDENDAQKDEEPKPEDYNQDVRPSKEEGQEPKDGDNEGQVAKEDKTEETKPL